MKSIVIILILLAAGAVYIFLNDRGPGVINLGEGVTIMADGTIKGNYSIEDIQGVGTPYECTFRKTDQSAFISGIIRMADDMVRGDFDIEISPEAAGFGDASPDNRAFFASHFIAKDNTTYTWTSLQNVGYKSPIVESAERNASETEQAQIVGLQDKVEYECKPWNAVLNVFDPPAGVTFLELTQ